MRQPPGLEGMGRTAVRVQCPRGLVDSLVSRELECETVGGGGREGCLG